MKQDTAHRLSGSLSGQTKGHSLNITLSDELFDHCEKALRSGQFKNASDYIEHAIRLEKGEWVNEWKSQEELDKPDIMPNTQAPARELEEAPRRDHIQQLITHKNEDINRSRSRHLEKRPAFTGHYGKTVCNTPQRDKEQF